MGPNGMGNGVEYALTWVGCSIVLIVSATHKFDNETNVRTASDVTCQQQCESQLTNELSKSDIKWKYDYGKDNGPHVWPQKSRTCGGKHQSPIDLDTTTSVTKHHPRLYWWNYSLKPRKMMLQNNGHSAMLKGEWSNPDDIPSFWLSTGNFSEKEDDYVFDQIHFHWGSHTGVGSEHTINSVKYPLEMHVVHRKRKFRDVVEAIYAGHGSAIVIALLFKVSNHENESLKPIVSVLRDIQVAGSKTEMDSFEIRRFLPEFSNHFLMYNGSLTIPPCTEGVSWVVKLETFSISMKQLDEFRLLRDHNNEPLIDNYRPVQPLNGRTVWHIK